MSTKRKIYSTEFKAKIVLEVLEGNETLNQIATKYELLPANVKNWKKMFIRDRLITITSQTNIPKYRKQIARACIIFKQREI